MPSVTTNYGLVTFDPVADVGSSQLSFRNALAQNTVGSNMGIIDVKLKLLFDSVAALSISAGTIRVAATESSSGVYTTGVIVGISAYATGIVIDLSLSTTIPGTSTLNINSLGAKSLMKLNSAGTIVNMDASDLRINKHYLFIYDGTQWVWINAVTSDQINVISGVSGNFLKTNANGVIADSGSSVSTFAVAAKGVTNGDTHDHVGGDGNAIVEGALSLSDITTANASNTAHGLVVKATAPAANVLNVVGLTNGETVYTNKSIFDSTNPAAIGTVLAGTSLIASHRDHVHAADHVNLANKGTITHADIDTFIGTHGGGIADSIYAPISKGVTNGDTHVHATPFTSGGGQIDYNSLANLPSVLTAGTLNDFNVLTIGSGTYTRKTDTTKMFVITIGGGGGGGGCAATAGSAGGGGGAGGKAMKYYFFSIASSFSYSVGAGGAGNSNANGGTGGDTTFDAMIGNGGVGGTNGTVANGTTIGGSGGAAVNGNLSINGNNGGAGSGGTAGYVSGHGANSDYGAGGISRTSAGNGFQSGGYGSGGSGAAAATAAVRSGGGGAGGIILIYEYK